MTAEQRPERLMRYGTIPGVSKRVSRLVQGTLMLARMDERAAFGLLDAVFEAGGTAFDTAPVYGPGKAEELVGSWTNSRNVRDQVLVIDKGGHPRGDQRRVSPECILEDLNQSLARLSFDSIDLYLLHRDDPDVGVDELVDCLDSLQCDGKIGGYGASNWTHTRIAQANDYAARAGRSGFVASSPEFGLAVPQATWAGCLHVSGAANEAARRWYAQSRMPVFAWSPLAGGFLCTPTRQPPAAGELDRATEFYGSADNLARRDRLARMARERGVTMAELALAFVFASDMDVYATVGANTGAQFRENVRGLSVTLATSDAGWLLEGA